jgi:WD40 repeat protein
MITGLQFSADGERLAVARKEGRVEIWAFHPDGSTLLQAVSAPDGWATHLEFIPEGLLVGGWNGCFFRWKTAQDAIRNLYSFTSKGLLTAFSPDGQVVASLQDVIYSPFFSDPGKNVDLPLEQVIEDTYLIIQKAPEYAEIQFHTANQLETRVSHALPQEILFSPDGSRFVLQLSIGIENDWEYRTYLGKTGDPAALNLCSRLAFKVGPSAVSRQGDSFAMGSLEDASIHLGRLEGGTLIRLHGHKARITALAYRPDGKQIASASDDHTLRLWDLAGKHDFLKIDLAEKITALAWTEDGRTLACGDEHGEIWTLESEPGAAPRRMLANIGRKLHPEGSFISASKGPSAYAEIAAEQLNTCLTTSVSLDRERFVAAMRQSGVPEDAIQEYLANVSIHPAS